MSKIHVAIDLVKANGLYEVRSAKSSDLLKYSCFTLFKSDYPDVEVGQTISFPFNERIVSAYVESIGLCHITALEVGSVTTAYMTRLMETHRKAHKVFKEQNV